MRVIAIASTHSAGSLARADAVIPSLQHLRIHPVAPGLRIELTG
jgi:hypothetical protein